MRLITGFTNKGYDSVGKEETRITSSADVGDLILLHSTPARNYPKLINHEWDSEYAQELYKAGLASGNGVMLNPWSESRDYNVYECDPCDDWSFWTQIYMEDILINVQLFSLLWDAVRMFKTHTHWEGDIMSGPYVSVSPDGGYAGTLILALKQGNNGSTYYCTKAELPDLKEYQVHERSGLVIKETQSFC